MDDCNWKIERWTEIKEKVEPYLAECGYDINCDVFWIPISGIMGDNIKVKSAKCAWYTGPTLLELLD
jgi:peptide chain release factor subunit 3